MEKHLNITEIFYSLQENLPIVAIPVFLFVFPNVICVVFTVTPNMLLAKESQWLSVL